MKTTVVGSWGWTAFGWKSGPGLPTQEGDANGAGEANHSVSANANSEALEDEEHENQAAENE